VCSSDLRFTSKGDNIQSWFWDLGDGTLGTGAVIKHQYNYPGTYFVMLRAESSAGCVNTYQLGPYTLSLPEISIPNVFTPNGDGVNDLLFSGYTGDQNFNWIITDRWGVKQFESRNANEGWDGKDLNGQVVNEGVYFYSLTIGQRSFSGNISIIR
jgi:gliding motility-associated-like protein